MKDTEVLFSGIILYNITVKIIGWGGGYLNDMNEKIHQIRNKEIIIWGL